MTNRALMFMAPVVLVAGCQTDMTREQATACEDPRPEICTREYMPVCASLTDQTMRTYANGCEACADKLVETHQPGACD